MNATNDTAKKPYINLVVNCSVYDEYAEGPSFVVIKFDMDTLLEIGKYRRGLEEMQNMGLNPHKVTSFHHTAMFLDPIEANPLNEEEQKSLRFLSDCDKIEWESRFEPIDEDYIPLEDGEEDEEVECSELDYLDGDHCIQSDMINITNDSMSFTGYIKYTGVLIESSVLRETEMDKITKWVEEL